MAVFSTIIAAIGVAATVAGTVVSMKGAQQQAKAQKQAIAFQMQAEQARKQQMEMDAARRKRANVREAQIARATALATATNQGAAEGSGLQGGFGQIAGQSGVNILGIENNRELGGRIFDANAGASMAYQRAADAGTMSAMGAGISSLGGAITKNSGTIARIGG